jgi:hypothetical protein
VQLREEDMGYPRHFFNVLTNDRLNIVGRSEIGGEIYS